MLSAMLTHARPAAVAFGLAAHAYCKKNEPGPIRAILTGLGAFAVLAGALHLELSLSLMAAAGEAFRLSVIFLGTLFASMTSYRVSPFHPLATYPGPFWCRVSIVPWFIVNLGWHTRFWLEKAHEKYGPIVRIGPNELSINDVDGLHEVQGYKGWIRSKAFNNGLMTGSDPTENGLPRLRNKEVHRARRRIFEKAFVTNSLAEYEPGLYKEVSKLLELFDRRSGTVVNLSEFVRLFAWDVMNLLVFSIDSDTLGMGKDPDDFIINTMTATRNGMTFECIPWLRDLLFAIAPSPPLLAKLEHFADKMFKDRRTNGSNGVKDIFYHLLGEDSETNVKLTDGQLQNESFTLILAGSDTTASAYTLIFYFLLQAPEILQRLQAELEERFGQDETITVEGTRDLPLLNAVITESSRLLSIQPAGTTRECPSGGRVLAGKWFIPEGTDVRFPGWVIMRDEKNFSDPNSWRPDRWITPENEAAHEPRAYFPFNIGSHACVGKHLALQELRLAITATVLNYDVQLDPSFDADDWFNDKMWDAFFWSFNAPLPVTMSRKVNGKKYGVPSQ